jgi:hypothetical protein
MRTHKIVWEKKGHTKIKIHPEDLVTNTYWPQEIYNSGVEYLIYINPSLREKKTFLCSISVCHRNHTYESSAMYKGEDGKWALDENGRYARRPCRMMQSALYANIEEGRNNYTINTYSSAGRYLSDQILMESMDLFMLARNEFYRIFRANEDHTNNS